MQRLGLTSFCRTTGGKGLHVVVPLEPAAHWDAVKPFCRAFAETLSQEQPERFLSTVKKADRRGRILIDWLRNGLGATAVASFCPRARPGATVATPLAWDEVNASSIPRSSRCATRRSVWRDRRVDPWEDFDAPGGVCPTRAGSRRIVRRPRKGKSRIVTAAKPKRRR